jgi:hypothetical protein
MPALASYLAKRGIAITAIGESARIVLHMQIDNAALQQVVEAIQSFFDRK